jgi:stringent starvation protein B
MAVPSFFLNQDSRSTAMTSSRPYLVRAIYEWLNDNNLTPHVLIDATQSGVVVPTAHIQEGRIVLNIMPSAVRDLFIHNDALSFSARFGGVPMQIYAPMQAVLAIYARENGEGMFFNENEKLSSDDGSGDDEPPQPPKPPQSPTSIKPSSPAGKRPALRVVK